MCHIHMEIQSISAAFPSSNMLLNNSLELSQHHQLQEQNRFYSSWCVLNRLIFAFKTVKIFWQMQNPVPDVSSVYRKITKFFIVREGPFQLNNLCCSRWRNVLIFY